MLRHSTSFAFPVEKRTQAGGGDFE